MKILVLGLGLVMFLTNCKNIDQTLITEVEVAEHLVTDAWISEMKSFEEDRWHYEFYAQENGDYIALSDSRLLKVNKDGILQAIHNVDYGDDLNDAVRIYDDRIYRFKFEFNSQNFDPTKTIKVEIYNFDLVLLDEFDMGVNGWIYDVEIENENLVGMLVYDADQSTMTLKKLSLDGNLLSEIVLSTNGTHPRNLEILSTGEYLCTDSSNRDNMILLDNSLNILWEQEFQNYVISGAEYVAGQGIYITGSEIVDGVSSTYFVALVDLDGNLINTFEFDGGDRWSPRIVANDERICLMQTEPESSRNMLLSFLDYDLNFEGSLDIPGNIVQSNLLVNENGSFSFVYGIAFDPDNPDFFPSPYFTRIFKFDRSYTLPINIIEQ